MRVRTIMALVPLVALVGCGGSEGKAEAGAGPPVSAVSTPASPPTPADAPSAPAGDVLPGRPATARLAGMWRGPRNDDGTRATIWIQQDGHLSMESGGFTCQGKVRPFGEKYRISFTECVAPIPAVLAALSPDGMSMTVFDSESPSIWYLVERPR